MIITTCLIFISRQVSPERMAFFSLLTYLLVGTIIFSYVEGPAEEERIEKAEQRQRIRNVTIDFDEDSDQMGIIELFNMTEVDILAMIRSHHEPDKVTIVYRHSETYEEKKQLGHRWNFIGSLFFCITLLTTIGYGHLAPATTTGQLLCVLYAVPGIPLYVLIVQHIRDSIDSFARWLRNKPFFALRAPQTSTTLDGENDETIWIVTFSLYAFSVLAAPVIFVIMENWDYLSAFYYNFVTLSTIGFGDMMAGASHQLESTAYYNDSLAFGFYRLYLVFWFFLGIPVFHKTTGLLKQFYHYRFRSIIHNRQATYDEIDHSPSDTPPFHATPDSSVYSINRFATN